MAATQTVPAKTFDIRTGKGRVDYLVALADHRGYRVRAWVGNDESHVRVYFCDRQDRHISIDEGGGIECHGSGSSWKDGWYAADAELTDVHNFITEDADQEESPNLYQAPCQATHCRECHERIPSWSDGSGRDLCHDCA